MMHVPHVIWAQVHCLEVISNESVMMAEFELAAGTIGEIDMDQALVVSKD